MARLAGVLCSIVAVWIGLPIQTADASTPSPIVIEGVGAAHGFGLAMDGVEGQARAGWTHDRILSLFYPGTTTGHASGVIRVGLAEVGAAGFTLASGGTVSDAPRGVDGSGPFPVNVVPGTRVSVALTAAGLSVLVGGKPVVSNAPPSKKPTGAPKDPAKKDDPAPDLLPTPPPAPILEPTPSPKPTPKRTEGPSATSPGALAGRTIWIWGAGDPALVGVDATGRRYRGTISVVPRGGKLTVVNHVDLETYVAGIAEEKGAGWPLEGMKTLAIAARTLGAATLGWYSRNHGNGYDICPTENCQVYLGYDGEEPIMRQATAETAGVIRTYNGRPILAMYHGNGGGQTESYKRVIDNGTDPHPYLASVKYPFADPSHWKKETTLPAMEAALRASDIAIAGTLERVEVVERGESPRVMRLKLVGSEGDQDVGGTRFASALELRSTWFDFAALGERSSAIVTGRMIAVPVPPAAGWTSSSPARPPKWWTFPLTTALALSALICAVRLAASLEAMSFGAWLLALWRTRLRVRHATS